MQITSDNRFLLIGEYGHEVFFYEEIGSSFVLLQLFDYGNNMFRKPFITDDHQYLVSINEKMVFIYEYNSATGLFDEPSKPTLNFSFVNI